MDRQRAQTRGVGTYITICLGYVMTHKDPHSEQDARLQRLAVRVAQLPAGTRDRQRARCALIEGYLPMADRLARRYRAHRERREDLVQVARLALVKAVDGYRPELGGFVGYAVPTIVGELKRYFRDQCWDMRIPRRLQEMHLRINSRLDPLSQRLGHSPSVGELADDIGVPAEEVEQARAAGGVYTLASLNVPVGGDATGCELGELVGGPDDAVEQVPARVSLRRALSRLPERERTLLRMRFLQGRTQDEIAEQLGVSQMHVSRLLSRTFAAIRDWMNGTADDVVVGAERPRGAAA